MSLRVLLSSSLHLPYKGRVQHLWKLALHLLEPVLISRSSTAYAHAQPEGIPSGWARAQAILKPGLLDRVVASGHLWVPTDPVQV